MKKIIALTMAMLMVLCLFAACGESGTENKEATPTEGNATEPTEEAATFTTVEEGKLTMATNAFFPPYEYY
jgi:polar amino acid transport system substrate-binding protein